MDIGMPYENADRMADVFQRLRAYIGERQVCFAGQVFIHPLGDCHASRRRTALNPDGQVDALAKEVIVLDHHVGHDNSGAQLQRFAIGCGHRPMEKLLLQS